MTLSVAVVPSTPLVLPGLPGAPEPTIATLAEATGRAMTDVAAADLAVVVAGGTSLAVTGGPSTDLTGYGLRLPEAHRAAADPTDVSALRGVTGVDVLPDGHTDPDLAVLCRLVPDGPAVLGLTVPADVTAGLAEAVAAVLAVLASTRHLALIVSGDLGAGHGVKPPRPGAATASTTYDQTVVAALDTGRPRDLVPHDPATGVQAAARGAGPLRLLGAVLQHSPVATVVRASAAPLGVGYVVAQGG